MTRNVPSQAVSDSVMPANYQPQPGDLIWAKVTRIAQHTKLQLQDGRRSQLYVGDDIVVAYGNRYAPDQFEAEIPGNLEACHLVAAGGVASRAISKNQRLKWPTQIEPQGVLRDSRHRTVNLSQFSNLTSLHPQCSKPVIGVVGTSMNAGKTTAAAGLVKGLSRSGLGVAAVKATGTGAGNDMWAYIDAGARLTLDFTDAGYVSTYKLPAADIEACFNQLLNAAMQHAGVDVVITEVADGLLHHETADLVRSNSYRRCIGQTIFAAGDALGACAGVTQLLAEDIHVSAISGVLSASSLAAMEAERAIAMPVLTKAQLESPEIAALLQDSHDQTH